MATHAHVHTSCPRTTSTPNGTSRGARTLLGIALATAGVLAVLPGTSSADPAPTLAQVQAQVTALDLQVDVAVEDYQSAQVALEALRARSAAAEADVAAQQRQVATLQAQVGDVIAAAYRNSTAGSGLAILTRSTSPQAYLDKVSSLDQLSAAQDARLSRVTAARGRLQVVQRRAQADLAQQRVVEQQAAQHQQQVQSDLAASAALLGSLQAQQRAQVEAARAAEQAAAPAPASAGDPSRASRSRPTAALPTYTGPATGRAAVAVQQAYAKLGSPYVWGAGGPSTFDCSGLTSWVWAKAGVSLPHSAAAQYSSAAHIAQGDVQPGDLVFFGSPIHHVGIYVGGGNMISAPHTGDVVKVQPAFRSDYVGAARP